MAKGGIIRSIMDDLHHGIAKFASQRERRINQRRELPLSSALRPLGTDMCLCCCVFVYLYFSFVHLYRCIIMSSAEMPLGTDMEGGKPDLVLLILAKLRKIRFRFTVIYFIISAQALLGFI